MLGYLCMAVVLLFAAPVWLAVVLKAGRPEYYIVRAPRIVQLREMAIFATLWTFSAYYFLKTGLSLITPGSVEYSARDSLCGLVMALGFAIMLAAAVLSVKGWHVKYRFKRQEPNRAIDHVRARLRLKPQTKRTTRV